MMRGHYSKDLNLLIKNPDISDLKYWVHSPFISPKRNVTCNNEGNIIYYNNINIESFYPININKAYIIHFRYKSTEEFANKLKRGYSNWFNDRLRKFILWNIILDFQTQSIFYNISNSFYLL